MLTVTDLHAGYGRSEVLVGTSLEVKLGTIVALIGANGAGKTTTMRAISGTLAPTRGEVRLGGSRVDGLGAARIARLGLAHAPEGRKVFGPLSTEDNLLLGAFRWLPHLFGFRRQAKPALERVYDLFPRLAERRAQAAGTLSGGEQQMLAIGRALMARPKILLLDEPAAGLGREDWMSLAQSLGQAQAAAGFGMLLVDHNVAFVTRLVGWLVVLANGKVIRAGEPAAVLADAEVARIYLGDMAHAAH